MAADPGVLSLEGAASACRRFAPGEGGTDFFIEPVALRQGVMVLN